MSLPDAPRGRRWLHRDNSLSSRRHGEFPVSPRECRRTSESSKNLSSRSPSGRKHSRSRNPSTSPPRACRDKTLESNSDAVSDNKPDDVNHEPQQTSKDHLTPSEVITQYPVGSDAKGKGRANSLQPFVQLNSISEQQPSLSDRNQSIRGHVPRTAETINIAATTRRPPRNKSLLESVKAHLAMNGSGSHKRFPRDHDLPSIDSLNIPEDPLAQMSTPFEKRSSAQKERPPARLSLNQDDGVPKRGQRAMSANLSSPESRTRLLIPLNHEKSQESQESSHLEHRETSFPTVYLSHVTISSRPDLDVKEASLRTQAQLRARLAAEKRLIEASGKP